MMPRTGQPVRRDVTMRSWSLFVRMKPEPELFDLDSGCIAGFLGSWGSDGVYVRTENSGWKYYAPGSANWDSFHQMVYRNHRANRVTRAELAKLGVAPPPSNPPAGATQATKWADNFTTELPLSEVPSRIVDIIRIRAPSPTRIYLVLKEDEYETGFGDGKWLYAESGFTNEEEARVHWDDLEEEALEKRKESSFWYTYTFKEVTLYVDDSGRRVIADLDIEPYEHYGLDDICRLLS